MGSAAVQGALWGMRPRDWAELQEPNHVPYFEAVLDAVGAGPGTRLLDVGCGSGLAAVLAAKRGARVSGLDAAEGLLAIARERLPEGDFRIGDLEELPWDAGTFDAVTAFNSIQYAADPRAAVAELRRVARPAAPVAVVVWAAPERNDAKAFLAAIGSLLPPPPPGAGGPFALSVPGVLEELLVSAGLEPEAGGEVPTPFEFADLDAAWRSVAAAGPGALALREAGEERVRAAITAAIAPFRQPDGRYRLENAFRYVVARA
jgi:SAM-dependent methyltransferase